FPGLLILWLISLFFLTPSILEYYKAPVSVFSNRDVIISPGSITVVKNASVNLSLKPVSSRFPSCYLEISSLTETKRTRRLLRPDTSGLFTVPIDSLKESFSYQFSFGGNPFKPETITVQLPPVLHSLNLRLKPPEYIGDSIRTLPDGQGDIKVYSGTEIEFSLQSEKLSSAWFISASDSIALDITGNRAKGKYTAIKNTAYTFSLCDIYGQYSDSLPSFHIDIIPDEPPVVNFLKPGTNREVSLAMVETLWVEGIDDLGVKSLKVKYRKSGQSPKDFSIWDISPAKLTPSVQKELFWNLNKLKMYPGDTLFYFAEIRDSWPYKPSHIGTSDTFWFRVPSFAEIRKRVAEQDKYAEENVENVLKNQDNIEDMLKTLLKSGKGNKELNWDQKQLLENIKEAVQAQADSLQNAIESLRKNVEHLKQEGMLGDETARKMQDVQKALEELIKQYGDSLFAQLKDLQQPTFDEMLEAVKKVEEMLPELNQRLQTTLQFLKMLKKDKEFAALAMKAQKMAQQQAQLADEQSKQRIIDQQQKLLNNIDDLKKEMSQLDDAISQPEAFDKINSLQKSMQSKLSNNQRPSSEEMNQMSGSLLSLSQQLRDMMSSTKAQKLQAENKLLLQMAHDLLNIADWQNNTLTELEQSKSDIRDIAITQQSIREAIKKIQAKTDSLKVMPPIIKQKLQEGFATALQTQQDAIQSLGETAGTGFMQHSEASINSLANTVLSITSGMQLQGQSQAGGGMMDGLRKLSGKQASINAATSELLRSMMQGKNSGSGNQAGVGKEGEAARKAAQDAQNALADELKKLAQKFGKDAGEETTKRVESLEQEARRLAAMLDNPQQEIQDRQDRFLSRMLQATLSMHKQDEGKDDRKSKAAETVFSEQQGKPGSIIDNPDSFHLLRRKALQGNYPPAYRSAISAYFDSLGVLFLKRKQDAKSQQ
ncbi:MAG: hypothetical protein GX640_06365, partial [Fibrobacter sp.]|nr:hypothetical protein [Fibrobacter sp.]